MPTDDLFGVFHEEGGLGHNDPYLGNPPSSLPRHRGKQFSVPGPVSGNLMDAMIDKVTRLALPGDRYVDPHALTLHLRRKNLVNVKPFVPAHPCPKGPGSGSLYGTFGPPSLILDTDASLGASSGRPATAPEPRRNIYVAAAKKGGYGSPWQHRTIGGHALEAMQDEYCRGRTLEKGMKRDARARFSKPFIGSANNNSDGRDSWLYAAYAKPAASPGRPATGVPKSLAARPQWRPSNPPVAGPGQGTLSNIAYHPNPTMGAKLHGKGKALVPFRPAGGRHSRLSVWSVNPYQYTARTSTFLDNSVALL
ncbi:MAG: hypothetical protein WDW38_004631 [Sanguina aurantia]